MQEVIVKKIEKSENISHIHIEMPVKEHICPVCGEKTKYIHDYRCRTIKDLPAFDKLEYYECSNTLINWQTEILNTFDYPYSNGFTEGCNNKIKVLKRNAYGYRNFKRFRNRIMHIFAYQKRKNEDNLKEAA